MRTDLELCSTMRARALNNELVPLDGASVLAGVCTLVAIALGTDDPKRLAMGALRVLASQQPMEVRQCVSAR